MAKPFDWTEIERQLDTIIDDRFGEDVTLIPWSDKTGIYVPGEEGPDLTRRIVATQACYVTPGASLVGEAGRATGGGFSTQVLEAECWISITLRELGGSIALWRAGDRVFLPMRGWFEISYLDDSATLRPNIHLIRTHDIMWGVGSPVSLVTPSMKGQLYFDSRGKKFFRAGDTTATGWVYL